VHALGFIADAIEIALTHLGVEIEAKLRRLHRNLGVQPRPLDLVEDVEIVLRDLLSFIEPGQILAKPRENREWSVPGAAGRFVSEES
jgi:hypothetical protein